MRRRLQNRIAESAVTLPTACVAATLLWWLPQGAYSPDYLVGWVLCALTAYVLVEMATVNTLMRVRSRMITALYLLLMAACGFLHPQQTASFTMLAVAVALYCLFRTLDQPRPEVDTFHAYLALSLGSIAWPPLLLLALPMLFSQVIYLRSLTGRSFRAALIGLLLPYFFWSAAAFVLGDIQPFVAHCSDIIVPVREPIEDAMAGRPLLPPTYMQWLNPDAKASTDCWHATVDALSSIDGRAAAMRLGEWSRGHLERLAALGVVALFALTGYVHYRRRSYDDKIRVRMCYFTIMSAEVVVTVWLALQPRQFANLMPLLLLLSVPPAAHFIALTHTRMTNFWSAVLGLTILALAVVSLALPFFL